MHRNISSNSHVTYKTWRNCPPRKASKIWSYPEPCKQEQEEHFFIFITIFKKSTSLQKPDIAWIKYNCFLYEVHMLFNTRTETKHRKVIVLSVGKEFWRRLYLWFMEFWGMYGLWSLTFKLFRVLIKEAVNYRIWT